MRNKKLIDSWNTIEPDKAARDRMLNNILKQTGKKQPGKEISMWKLFVPAAVCATALALVVALPLMQSGSPATSNIPAIGTTSNGETTYVPRWEERTMSQQYSELTFQGNLYLSTGAQTELGQLGQSAGAATAKGYDEYEDHREYSMDCTVYPVKGVSPACAVAVQYQGHDGHYMYSANSYTPQTLGDLVNDLNLRENLKFNAVYTDIRKDGALVQTKYPAPDFETVWNLLLSDLTLKNEGEAHYRETFLSISIDVPVLGEKNISLALNEDGYLQTNILGTAKSFFIGKEKAREFLQWVQQNDGGTELRRTPLSQDGNIGGAISSGNTSPSRPAESSTAACSPTA